MQVYQKKFIELSLQHQVLKFGDFTLKSGRQSPYFFNMGLFNSGATLAQLGEFYLHAIQNAQLEFDQLFGPAYKGIPLVSSTAIAFHHLAQKDIPYSYNRKEAKDHGEGGVIVGAPLTGRVLIIDDVMTAGTAVREAITLVQQSATVAGVVVALDRQEKGVGELSAVQEIAKQYQIPVISIINLENLIAYMQTEQHIDANLLARMHAYREHFASK